ncbi:hypothetical protein D5086_031494 [Populus alba]|uniref:Uncharacterized protein n=1 Tax=Populus alba TaxID=43335 RepID=A0ACC4AIQ5_POPAL
MPFYKVGFLHGDAAYASPMVTPIPQAAYLMQNPNDPAGIDQVETLFLVEMIALFFSVGPCDNLNVTNNAKNTCSSGPVNIFPVQNQVLGNVLRLQCSAESTR